MAAFFRGFLLFFFGAVIGAAGVLLFAPSFNVVVSRGAGSQPPLEIVSPLTPAPMVAKTPAVPAPAVPVAAAEAAKPAVVAAPKPAPAVAPAVAGAEPAIDFKAISQHIILWPTSVTVKTATTVPVLADGKKVQDLALEAGTVLQVSKVLSDGSLEVRAKGAKFEVQSALTDFSAELGKLVADLVAKGTKFDSPFAPAPVAPVASAAMPAPAVATPVVATPVAVAPAKPWGSLTLAQRIDVLFGNKPDAVLPTAMVAPVTTTPAVPVVAPAPAAVAPAPVAPPVAPAVEAAPAADPKAVEKGKDLDRKINQLFK